MGKIYEKLRGRLSVEVCGACVEGLLNAAALSAIPLWNVRCVDGCTVRLSMYETDYPALEALSEKCVCQLKPISLSGGSSGLSLSLCLTSSYSLLVLCSLVSCNSLSAHFLVLD
mgnify:CR=1 FL=1